MQFDSRVPKGKNLGDNEQPDNVEWCIKRVVHARLSARVPPIHKQVNVQASQRYGYGGIGDTCEMTGDDVKDAPALKQAGDGVAMGNRGTEVAKDAADIVLQDDDFSSVVNGIEQGRLCSSNLRKPAMHTLCSKVTLFAHTLAKVFGVSEALNVVQVPIDSGTDIWTAIACAFQPAESAFVSRAPRLPQRVKLADWGVGVGSFCYEDTEHVGAWFRAVHFWTVNAEAGAPRATLTYIAADALCASRGVGHVAVRLLATLTDARWSSRCWSCWLFGVMALPRGHPCPLGAAIPCMASVRSAPFRGGGACWAAAHRPGAAVHTGSSLVRRCATPGGPLPPRLGEVEGGALAGPIHGAAVHVGAAVWCQARPTLPPYRVRSRPACPRLPCGVVHVWVAVWCQALRPLPPVPGG